MKLWNLFWKIISEIKLFQVKAIAIKEEAPEEEEDEEDEDGNLIIKYTVPPVITQDYANKVIVKILQRINKYKEKVEDIKTKLKEGSKIFTYDDFPDIYDKKPKPSKKQDSTNKPFKVPKEVHYSMHNSLMREFGKSINKIFAETLWKIKNDYEVIAHFVTIIRGRPMEEGEFKDTTLRKIEETLLVIKETTAFFESYMMGVVDKKVRRGSPSALKDIKG